MTSTGAPVERSRLVGRSMSAAHERDDDWVSAAFGDRWPPRATAERDGMMVVVAGTAALSARRRPRTHRNSRPSARPAISSLRERASARRATSEAVLGAFDLCALPRRAGRSRARCGNRTDCVGRFTVDTVVCVCLCMCARVCACCCAPFLRPRAPRTTLHTVLTKIPPLLQVYSAFSLKLSAFPSIGRLLSICCVVCARFPAASALIGRAPTNGRASVETLSSRADW